jgi:hypothetical protein
LTTFVNAGWQIASENSTTWAIGFNGLTTYPWLSWQMTPSSVQIVNPD